MSAHKIYQDLAGGLLNTQVPQPSTQNGELALMPERAFQYVVCNTTSSVNGVTLPDPAAFGVGSRVAVFFDTKVSSSLSVIGPGTQIDTSANVNITFADAGDSVVFIVVQDTGVKQWRILHNDGGTAGA